MQRRTGLPIALPVESGVDHDRLGHSPRIIAKILSQILLLAPDDVTEHFIRPAHFSGDGLRVGVEKEFRTVEAQPAFRIVRARNPETVQLSRTHIRQEDVPDLIGVFIDRDTNVFFCGLDVVEQAKLNTGSVLGKDGKVHAILHPCCAQRIGVTEESTYRSHKRAAHLSGIESTLATTNEDQNHRRSHYAEGGLDGLKPSSLSKRFL